MAVPFLNALVCREGRQWRAFCGFAVFSLREWNGMGYNKKDTFICAGNEPDAGDCISIWRMARRSTSSGSAVGELTQGRQERNYDCISFGHGQYDDIFL